MHYLGGKRVLQRMKWWKDAASLEVSTKARKYMYTSMGGTDNADWNRMLLKHMKQVEIYLVRKGWNEEAAADDRKEILITPWSETH